MAVARIAEAEFVEAFESIGPSALAKKLQCEVRAVYLRRADIEKRIGRPLIAPTRPKTALDVAAVRHPQRIELTVSDGVVIVGSDGHFWPGDNSVAHRAMVKFVRELRPEAIIQNGDVFDGAGISRHPPIGWTTQPTVVNELEACQEKLHEIEKAKPRKARLVWSLGNHDSRFETRIATVAPEYANVHGVSLKDHFPAWEPCWSVWINGDVVIKHRFKGGIHAAHNNVMWAGKSMITGHLHSAKVSPFTDYGGTRYGVDTGCLAETYGAQFRDYTEDSPRNWRSGFCVLTFKDGRLLMPELVLAWDDETVQFRGELIAA